MTSLDRVSAALEWAARLAGPVVLWGFGVAGIVTGVRLGSESPTLAAAVGSASLVTTVTGLRLIVRAVGRLRAGPAGPPGEGL